MGDGRLRQLDQRDRGTFSGPHVDGVDRAVLWCAWSQGCDEAPVEDGWPCHVAVLSRSFDVPSVCHRLLDRVAVASAPRAAVARGPAAGAARPRRRRGVRHPFVAVMLVAACAVTARARSWAAIGQWSRAAPQDTPARLGARTAGALRVRVAPSLSTIRRIVIAVCPGGLADLTGQDPAGADTVAVDGKCARGSRHGAVPAVHLLAVMTGEGRTVSQLPVPARRTRSPASPPCMHRSTCAMSWRPPTPCTPRPLTPASSSSGSRRTCSSWSRPTSPTCSPPCARCPGKR